MEGDVISMQEIYRFRRRGIDKDGSVLGEFETTGVRPKVMELLASRGVDISGLSFAPSKRGP